MIDGSILSRATVVIVTWNSAHLIERCLAPFHSSRARPRVVVYDNASSDNTVATIRKNFAWVHLIEGDDNIGFGRANNVALSRDDSEFYILLNPDAFVSNMNDVESLLKELDRSPDVGAVGPMLLHGDGTHQVGDAGWATSLRSVVGHVFGFHKFLTAMPSIYLSNKSLLTKSTVEVDWICGACLVIRRDAWRQMQGFDDSIFMYGEDVDLGERLKKSGWRCIYVPEIKVTHLQGGTQGAAETSYYSSKWMLARARRFANNNNLIRYGVLKKTFVWGYALRYLALKIFSSRRKNKAEIYRRFSQDAANLPTWKEFNKES